MNQCTQQENRRSSRWPWLIFMLSTSMTLGLCSSTSRAESTDLSGLLWSVQGEWHHENGKLSVVGDAIAPGELLQPSATNGGHRVVALLPDGQRLLYQCFASRDCARGFRVPQLNATPSAFAIEMLNRIRLAKNSGRLPPDGPTAARTVPPASDELVLTLTPQVQIRLTGLVATLAPGSYTYDLIRIGTASTPTDTTTQHRLPLQKASEPALLPLPGPGLYEVRIADSFNTQRIHLLVLAARIGDAAAAENFARAGQMLREWNEKSGGWPLHSLLRLYLLSLAEASDGPA